MCVSSSNHHSVSTMVHLEEFFQEISLSILFSRFTFFSTYLDTSPIFFWVWDILSTLYWKFWLIPSKKYHSRIIWIRTDYPFFCCLHSIINILIVYRSVLLLILIILVRHYVYFMLIWSVQAFLAFCLLRSSYVSFFKCQHGRQL